MKLTEKEIGGVECEIHVSNYGLFTVQIVGDGGGRSLGSDAVLEKAVDKAAREIRKAKVKVEIPFVHRSGERGVAYGIHAGNKTILAKVGGESVQISGYGGTDSVFSPEIPDDVLAEYAQAHVDVQVARKTQQRIESAWDYPLRRMVEEAIAEAQHEEAQEAAVAAAEVRDAEEHG